MNQELREKVLPNGSTKYLFFGGKGGVGKTTMATATAIWFADHNYKTTIVSTDPTVSLSAIFNQHIGGDITVPINTVPNLNGLNINPLDAKGVFQKRLNSFTSEISGTFNNDMVSSPCIEEMATFDQFVSFLEKPESEVIIFDTAPTGKSLRELAMPFDWASFMHKQLEEGQKLALLLPDDTGILEDLERDKQRYDNAMSVLSDSNSTVFSLVLIPERLPIEETQSAITGLNSLGISVQSLLINQCILPEVIEQNRFLKAREELQKKYLSQIYSRFSNYIKIQLPLLDKDASDLSSLREIGRITYES
ncbi:MAG: TRC40/GET3/ArsA family transport-energizing ATPase [bacterium]